LSERIVIVIIVRPATAVARSALVLAALFVGLLAPGAVTPGNAAGGATYNVATTGANTPTCGTTSSPCGAIQYTINNRARPGDTINVASGVYTETLTITEDLTITGAGAGQTIVDGNGAGSVATVPGAYTVALNNLTLRNGSATAGGGLASTGGALTLSGATVANNTVTSDGGGVSVVSGTLTLTNSTVANNTATGYGGGIEAESSPVMLTASQVVNNTASYGDGGGIDIYNDDATSPGALTVTNSTIVSNTATAGYGGGINENDAPVTLMRNSTVNGNTGGAGGGGLDLLDTFDNSPGALTVDNSAIVSNTTTGFGGGIQAYSPVTVTNSRIVSNTAAGHGGGLDYSYDGAFAGTVSAASIVNSQVLSNTATAPTTTTFGLGGGLDVESGTTVTVTGSTLAGNTADYGGAILNDYSAPISGSNVVTGTTLILTNSVVVSNTATRNGGGVSNDGGQVQVTTSMVAGNAARYGGGLYNYDHFTGSIAVIGSGTIAVANSAIVSNTTTLDGGGVSNDVGSTLTMTNSTIAGNTAAGFGGGILTYSSTVALVNDTVAGNTSPNSGGGISIANTNSLSTTLTNSILALNNAPRGPDCNGAFTSGGYNVVGSTSGGCAPSGGMGDVTNRDPRLGPLRDNGGPTLTRALLPDSPAIDLVSPASCAGLTTDQRGFPRPFPVGGACDAGAYEYQPVVTGLSPTSGPAAGGTSVIITGVDLEGATGVSFGGVAATGVVADPSGRSVMATSPAHAAGPVDVQAAVMAGTGVVTSTATMSGAFTYVAAPPPTRAQPSLRSVPTRRSPRRARRSPRRARRDRQQAPTRRSRRQTPRSPRSPSSCP